MTLNSILIYEKELIQTNLSFLKIGLALLIIFLAIAILLMLRQKQLNAKFSIGCVILAIAALATFYHSYDRNIQEVEHRAASLTEVPEFINVEDDEVTIQSLDSSERYKYSDKKTEQERMFKIGKDERFETYYLTDQSGRKFLIDNEEYEMLNAKRHSS